jgi:hypothetical protein
MDMRWLSSYESARTGETLMKNLKTIVVIAAIILGPMTANLMAAGRGGPDPYAIKIESPFKGVVGNISASSLSVKGEVMPAHAPKDGSSGKSKPNIDTVRFSLKGAKLTRNGKPCELKDVQKGDTASVTFTTKADSDKRTATAVDFSTGGADADEKKAEGKK